jgi:hypothetical protein
MKRATLLLTVLGLILVLAAWFMFVWSPRAEAIAETEAAIVDVQAQQATTRARIADLQGVREQAPQLQAELAAAESLLPRDTALPSALRQLQTAADESQVTLVSVAPARPEAVDEATPGLSSMTLSTELRGTYFQIVDVLRRLEDPTISPRGLVWDTAALSVGEERPELTVILTGRMFAVLPHTPAPEAAGSSDAPEVDGSEVSTEDDAEVDQEVEQ